MMNRRDFFKGTVAVAAIPLVGMSSGLPPDTVEHVGNGWYRVSRSRTLNGLKRVVIPGDYLQGSHPWQVETAGDDVYTFSGYFKSASGGVPDINSIIME